MNRTSNNSQISGYKDYIQGLNQQNRALTRCTGRVYVLCFSRIAILNWCMKTDLCQVMAKIQFALLTSCWANIISKRIVHNYQHLIIEQIKHIQTDQFNLVCKILALFAIGSLYNWIFPTETAFPTYWENSFILFFSVLDQPQHFLR